MQPQDSESERHEIQSDRLTQAAGAAARRRPLRWFAVLLVAAVAVGMPLLALAWLIGTAGGLATCAALAQNLSGGTLVVDGASGRLLGPLRIARIAYRDAGMRIEARDVSLDWRFELPPDGAVFVPRADIAALDIATRPSDRPPVLPRDLTLPFALHVDRLQVRTLRVLGWTDAASPPALFEIGDLAARFASDGRQHKLDALRLVAPFATLTGSASLDGAPPFPLAASLRADGAVDAKSYRIDALVKGPLDALALTASASGWNLAGEAEVAITPFAPIPLKRAKLALGEIDPAAFAPGAPRAALHVTADLVPRNPQAGTSVSPDQWELAGPLAIVNRAPGAFDRNALPFSRLDARALWRQGRLSLDDLVLLSPGSGGARDGGRLAGAAVLETGALPRLRVELAASGVDPQAWVSVLKPARLSGKLAADATATEQQLDATLSESGPRIILRNGPPWQAGLSLRHRDGTLDVSRLRLSAGDAAFDASGRIALGGERSFDFAGKLTQFDPSLYAKVIGARLTADLAARGALAPALHADVRFDLHDSQLATRHGMRPLAGKGVLRVQAGRVADADIALDLAGNRLSANGAFGKPGDALAFVLDAPALDALGIGLAGRVEAKGTLAGSADMPSGEISARASSLRAGDSLRLDSAKLDARLREGLGGRLDATLEIERLRGAAGDAAWVERASLAVAGTRGDHTLQGSAGLGGGFALQLAAHGALLDGAAWKGWVDALKVDRGEVHLALARPAALAASAARVELGAAELRGRNAALRIDEAGWTPAGWYTRGDFSGAQVGVTLDAQQQLTLRGRSLALGGAWDVRAGAALDGMLEVHREAGDLTVESDLPVELGLRQLALRLAARQGMLDVALDAEGERIGQLDLRAQVALERDGNLWRPSPHAPLQGRARFAMPSIAWIGTLLGPNVQLGGALGGSFEIGGTAARPDARGTVRAAGVSVALIEHGLRLSDGEIDIELTQERARLSRFDFRADPRVRPNERRIELADLADRPGRLTGSGEIELSDGKGTLRFTASRLAVLQRADRWLMMSGEAQLATAWDALALSGALRADAGYFELAATAPPALDDDVVILGRQAKAVRPLRLDIDLALDLGRRLYLKGRGLDARLTGEVRLRADGRGPLRASGSISTREGTYDAYGQVLKIERGIINFQGSPENAGLNVRALRTGLPVEAGVEITGTVLAPRVRLVSEPQVPDSEKLSWIVLGRGQDQAGGADSALLLSAADSILGGQVGGISRQLAQSLGLDQISVSSGDISGGNSRLPGTVVAGSTLATRDANLTSQIVTLGKRISSDAYLSYEHSLAGAASVVKLTYNLTRRLSVIGRAGTDNSVDLLYSISFR